MSLLPHLHFHPTTPHHPTPFIIPSSMCASIFSPAHSPHPCPLTTTAVWPALDLTCSLSFISFIVHSPTSFFTDVLYHLFHIGKAVNVRSGVLPNLPNCLSAYLGAGVPRSSIVEVPRSPVSSSVSPAGRNTTLSRPKVSPQSTHNGVLPFYPPKTLTKPLSSSTTGGNGVPFPIPLILSSQVASSGYHLLSASSHSLLQLCIYRRRQISPWLLM